MSAPRLRALTAPLRGERGAAAVEFALVVPLLLLFVFGIVSVSRAFQVQATLSAAAREAARSMALGNSVSAAKDAAVFAASTSSLALSSGQVSVSPSTCTGAGPGTNVTVTITYSFAPMGDFAGGAAFDITSKAVVRCGG
jgi:Flp pilus assembly protein TadG